LNMREAFEAQPYSPALLRDMASVQAHYLLRVLRETGGAFAACVVTQTSWRATLPAMGPNWDRFVEQAEALLLSDADSVPEDRRVDRFLAYAAPLFAAGPMATGEIFAGQRWFGCFGFGSHPEDNAISIHIRNACRPHSPFDDLPACFRSMKAICEAAEAGPFPVRKVTCGTWLNDLSVFVGLFPPSYRATLKVSPPDSKGGWGWWGQLVDRNGRLHARRAAAIMETGRFPHPRKEGWCGFEEFKQHVVGPRG